MRNHVALAAIVAGLIACGRDLPQPPVPNDVTAVRMTSGTVESSDLDDAQIATVAETIRDGLEERARLAVDHGSDGVRRFARRVLADDPGVSITLMSLAPRPSVLGDELAGDTHAASEGLAAAQGAPDFDRRFAESERKALRTSIDLIERRLIPDAQNVQLRMNLQRMAATLRGELHDLEALIAELPS